MRKKLMLFSTIALFAFCGTVKAQEDEAEFKIVKEVKETSVLNHKVEAGETIMLIAKKYLVRPVDIYEINPGIAEGISPDMIVKIPAEKIKIKLKPEQKNNIRTEQVAIIKKYD